MVLFLRLSIESQERITAKLEKYYIDGWRIVAHTADESEYTFVLERLEL
jgi:hypothetical protein